VTNYPQRKRKKPANAIPATRDINAATRVQTALKLKIEGMTWDEVAANAGYGSRGTAHRAVMREFERCISKDVDELRTMQLYMLSQLQVRCYKAGMDEGNKDWTWAVDRFVSLSKRISEITGIDTPVDVAMSQNVTIIREVPQGYLGIVEAPITQ